MHQIDLFRYDLPLRHEVVLGPTSIRIREGFLVRIQTDSGDRWGEAAPLPGFSRESMDDCRQALEKLARRHLDHMSVDDIAVPSARWAFDSALHLPAELPGRITQIRLLHSARNATDRLIDWYEQGFRVVKLKVGRYDALREAQDVLRLLKAAPLEMRFRLDANRAWTFDEAVTFWNTIESATIDYLEEPVRSTCDLQKLVNLGTFPVGLDESLREPGFEPLLEGTNVRAAILKPMMMGSIERIVAFARILDTKRIEPVISSAYESGIGLLALLRLAAMLEVKAGIDTYETLADDVLSPRPGLNLPMVGLGESCDPVVLDTKLGFVAHWH